MDDDIRERLERLEANEAIRQLASRYALAVIRATSTRWSSSS